MKASWKWLQEFVDLSDLSPERVADVLSRSGLEVEAIERPGAALDGVVVARIDARAPHPDADRLSVVDVDAGASGRHQIVCGATNFAVGDRVPLALVGTTLPNGLTIKPAKLRGVPSHGMLCSATELGLPEGEDGLLILPEDAAIGAVAAEALGLDDVVFELGLTPNRGDCLSIYGIARDVAAVLDRPLKRTLSESERRLTSAAAARTESAAFSIEVSLQHAGCPRYAAMLVENVRAAASPTWLRSRLELCGVRSINTLVDLTNYVMLETGQPLHAFDASRLRGGRLVIRPARDGERLECLDHVVRELSSDDMIIADAEGPVALAGVMGGIGSEVSEDTTEIVIECAHFDPSLVRRSARRHGLHTDSSHRFERTVDPAGVLDVVERTAALLARIHDDVEGPAPSMNPVVDLTDPELDLARRTIDLDPQHFQRLVGAKLSAEEQTSILERLDLTTSTTEKGWLRVHVPTRRPDLVAPVDLVEELIRVHGYDRIPSSMPPIKPGGALARRADRPPVEQIAQPISERGRSIELDRLRVLFCGQGFYEAVNSSMVDPKLATIASGEEPPLRLQNPLGEDSSAMRVSLIPGLLTNTARNIAIGAERVALFEMARVFPALSVDGAPEPLHVAGALCGHRRRGWYGVESVDAHDLTGLLASVGDAVGRPLEFSSRRESWPAWTLDGARAAVSHGGQQIGVVAHVHPDIADHWDIAEDVFGFELNLTDWLSVERPTTAAPSLSRYPSSSRDISLLVGRETTFEEILEIAAACEQPWRESLELFDKYEGKGIEPGRKSLSLRVTYRNPEGSLRDEEVDALERELVERWIESLGAARR